MLPPPLEAMPEPGWKGWASTFQLEAMPEPPPPPLPGLDEEGMDDIHQKRGPRGPPKPARQLVQPPELEPYGP